MTENIFRPSDSAAAMAMKLDEIENDLDTLRSDHNQLEIALSNFFDALRISVDRIRRELP